MTLDQSKLKSQLEEILEEINSASVQAKTLVSSLNKLQSTIPPLILKNPQGDLLCPEFHPQVNYSQLFWKTYTLNQKNIVVVQQMGHKVQELEKAVKNYKVAENRYTKKLKFFDFKRSRRVAKDIDRSHNCPYENCYKTYGTDVSLNLHIKVKHNGGSKSQRQRMAREVCLAELEGKQIPKVTCEFPPGYLEQIKEALMDENQRELWNEKK